MADPLSFLLPRFGFDTGVFFSGDFCGTTPFSAAQQIGHLHLVREGKILLEHDDGKVIEAGAGCLVFYARPLNHRLLAPRGENTKLICAGVRFREPQRNPLAAAFPEVMVVPLDQLAGLEPVLTILFDEAAVQAAGSSLVLDRLCDIIVVLLVRHAQASGLLTGAIAGMGDAAIARALTGVHKDLSYPWRIDDLARLATMSRTKFTQHFQQRMGMAPGAYLLDARMAQAEALLRDRRSVKEVGIAVGYASQPAFSRAFTAHSGMAPQEWQRSQNDAADPKKSPS